MIDLIKNKTKINTPRNVTYIKLSATGGAPSPGQGLVWTVSRVSHQGLLKSSDRENQAARQDSSNLTRRGESPRESTLLLRHRLEVWDPGLSGRLACDEDRASPQGHRISTA